jgi:hypothetical protein
LDVQLCTTDARPDFEPTNQSANEAPNHQIADPAADRTAIYARASYNSSNHRIADPAAD